MAAPGCSGDPAAPDPTPTDAGFSSVEVIRPIELTEQARQPENDPGLEDVEVFPDRLIFHLQASSTLSLEPGNVVSGVKGNGYLRKIRGVVQRTETLLEVTTDPAELVDLIADGAFKA